jgi:hypothetical protein
LKAQGRVLSSYTQLYENRPITARKPEVSRRDKLGGIVTRFGLRGIESAAIERRLEKSAPDGNEKEPIVLPPSVLTDRFWDE